MRREPVLSRGPRRVPGQPVYSAGEDQRRSRGGIGEGPRHRVRQEIDPLPRIETAEVEDIGSAEAVPPGLRGPGRRGQKPSGQSAGNHLDLRRCLRHARHDVAAARLAQGHDLGRVPGRIANGPPVEPAMEEARSGPGDESRRDPGDQIVEGEERGVGKAGGNAVIPGRVVEVGDGIDGTEHFGQLAMLPPDSPAGGPRGAHLDHLRDRDRIDGAVAHPDELEAARQELLQDLGQDEADSRGGAAREGSQVDGDSNRAGHAGARYGRRPERSTSPRM
jgi:hypothetical protein